MAENTLNNYIAWMEKTKEFEGWRDTPYMDTTKHRSVGYGFNLDSPEVSKDIAPDVVLGLRPMNRREADQVFQKHFWNSAVAASNWVGQDSWKKLSPQQRYVLTDMHYNMGNKLNEFKKMQKAITTGDYKLAAEEMKKSRWYGQVGRRSKYLYNLMKGS